MEEIEKIYDAGTLNALIVRDSFRKNGVTFFTEDSLSQQVAAIQHPAGKVIEPHVHCEVPRAVTYTQEVLLLKSGKLRVDFYTEAEQFICSRTLGPGDLVLLIRGGHGFEVLEEVSMIEVKQGPYVADRDKRRFARPL